MPLVSLNPEAVQILLNANMTYLLYWCAVNKLIRDALVLIEASRMEVELVSHIDRRISYCIPTCKFPEL